MIKKNIPIVTTGAGNPAKYIKDWKASGMIVIPVIPNPTLGVRMERLGVDAVIAEGMEAGGHIGHMTTLTLLPQTVKRLKIPVIAAGGIASGIQMLACEIMGAIGFQIGTAFLATKECPIHQAYKDKVIKATDTNVTIIGMNTGIPIRLLRNEMSREYTEKECLGWDKFQLEKFTLGALRRAVREGDVSTGSLMAGLTVAPVSYTHLDVYKRQDLKNKKFDILIIGAGITGLTTAYLLKDCGFNIGIIEATKSGYGVTGYTTAKITIPVSYTHLFW